MKKGNIKDNNSAITFLMWGFVFTFLLLGNLKLSAQEKLTPFVNKVDGSYNFWLHEPDVKGTNNQPIPLILFLHGKSLSGSNLEMVKRYGVLKEVLKRRKLPAYVLAPQCPRGKMWDPKKIIKIVDFIQKSYSTDTCRFYVVGMSMGGYGVLHFAGAFPDRIAAAVALCGGGNTKDGCRLAEIPLWIMHGTADRAVSYMESERMVNSIKQCNRGVNLKYDLLKGAGHGEPARLFSMDELYAWLFLHSKSTPLTSERDTISVDHGKFTPRYSKKRKSKKGKSKTTHKKSKAKRKS